MPSLTPDEVRQILDALEASEWNEAVVTVGDVSISMSRHGTGNAPVLHGSPARAPEASDMIPPGDPPASRGPSFAPAPALTPAPAPVGHSVAGDAEVLCPTVGMFWRSPQPGSPPFVEIGQTVEPGDVLCIVEVMKLMNNVASEVAGTVSAILVGNGAAVEHGQVLMTITPANG